MELADGVHSLPLSISVDERTMRLNPVAVETPRGPLLLDVGMPKTDCRTKCPASGRFGSALVGNRLQQSV